MLVIAAPNVMAIDLRRHSNGGVECSPGRYEEIAIFDHCLAITNDTRYGHSYYRRQIGNRAQAFEWYIFNDL